MKGRSERKLTISYGKKKDKSKYLRGGFSLFDSEAEQRALQFLLLNQMDKICPADL